MSDIATPCAGEVTNEIEIQALTTYEVAPDGSGIRMNVVDMEGNPASVIIPIDCLRALALTMPKMVSDAVSGGRGNPAIRVVHKVDSWFLERASDDSTILLTIETGDFLKISFAVSEGDLVALADGVSSHEAEAFSPQLRGH